MKYIFRIPKFHLRNFESCHYTREQGVSFVKTCRFIVCKMKISYVCEIIPVPHIFHMLYDMKSS